MKRFYATLALTAFAVFGAAQVEWTIYPNAFHLNGATTTQLIKLLYLEDSGGMVLNQLPRGKGGTGEVSIELTGNTGGISIYALSFNLAEIAVADKVIRKIELFNYTTNTWDMVLKTTGTGTYQEPQRPYLAPMTTITVKAGLYVHPLNGDIRTRVVWNARSPFRTIWIDCANWTLYEHRTIGG